LNVHFHLLVLDGAYSRNADASLSFWPVAAPDDDDVAEVAMRVYRRVLKLEGWREADGSIDGQSLR